jgi:hypothetical protein
MDQHFPRVLIDVIRDYLDSKSLRNAGFGPRICAKRACEEVIESKMKWSKMILDRTKLLVATFDNVYRFDGPAIMVYTCCQDHYVAFHTVYLPPHVQSQVRARAKEYTKDWITYDGDTEFNFQRRWRKVDNNWGMIMVVSVRNGNLEIEQI